MKTILPRFLSAACTLMAITAVADTKLVTDGAPLRYHVPTDGNLGGTWRGPGFNDSSWAAGANGIGYEVEPGVFNASVIASSQGEFSGQPGANSWINGYYNLSLDPDATYQATDFQPFPHDGLGHSATDFWTGSAWEWFAGDPPWDSIGAADVHPNGINNGEEHWVIRRWHSTVAGPITLRFHLRKSNLSGGGTTGKIFKNGVELFTQTIGGGDGTGFDAFVNTTVNVGDVFDFAHTPLGQGGDTGDGADGSIMTATILSGTVTPPLPPASAVADSAAEFSGVQGANGWFYGYYSVTADTDSTYDPNIDFNMTDPNWTFTGGAWQLGTDGNPGANPPWDNIGQTSWHPNGDNNLPHGIHWVIRRWVSDVDGELHARVRFAKANTSPNGTTLHVLHNGVEVYTVTLNNTTGVDTFVSFPDVFAGDRIEFALDPKGVDGFFGDGSDSSTFTGQIFTGPPPHAVVADSVADWSGGAQGANGWYYGYYNETADADATYNPGTDFNNTDPNWTLQGASWQLGADGNPAANPPWDTIGQTDWHPNGVQSSLTNPPANVHWVIKRWVADVDSDLHAVVNFGKQNVGGGNGTTLRVLHNGTQLFSQTIAFNNAAGINPTIALPDVFVGDTIEFALDPLGTDGSKADGSDGSYIRVSIRTGLPPEPPRPFLPGIADCFQTDIETAMKGVNGSVFIRIPFDVANPADIETLKLKMKYNDGFAAYLNGTEIAKRNAPTAIAGITFADSIADWSTDPNVTVNGWSYGYYNQSLDNDATYTGGADLTPFPHDGGGHSPTDFWNGSAYDWFAGNPPWTELLREDTHPNHPNALPFDPANPATHIHWTIRRWNATVDANLKARIRFRKINVNCGDGVRLSVFHNSVQVYSQTIAGNDGVGRDDTIELPDVFLGDNIDVLLGPGEPTGNDFCDGSAFSVVFFEGEPTIPWDGLATASRTPSQTISPEVIDISEFISQLTPGQNVLAIQGFNAGLSDNEFVINAELLANRIPTAANDAVTTVQDTPATYPGSALLGNDSDPDGDKLLLVGVTPSYVTAQGGAVRLFGDTVRYTPPTGFTGTDTFEYTVTDQSGVPIHALVTVTVEPPNQCPTASDGGTMVNGGGGAPVIVNFSLQALAADADGDPLQFSITQPPARGTVVLNGQTGEGTYTAAAAESCGSVSFRWKANDGTCDSAEATFGIAFADATPPTLVCPAPIVVNEGDPVTITPPAGADHCDGALSSTCVRADSLPLSDPYPVGSTAITCSTADAAGNPASCSFTVTVLQPNQPPVCVAELGPEKCGVTFPFQNKLYAIAVKQDYACLVLNGSGSSDPDGDALTITWLVDGTNMITGAVVTNCMDVGCHTVTMLVDDGRDRCHQFLDLCVITPSEAVEQCMLVVENTPVERKNKRPLLVSLKAAKAAFNREGWRTGALMLKVFQFKVQAQIAGRNPEEAAMFIQCAENILEALECVVKKTPRKGDDDGDDDDDRTRDDDDNGGAGDGDDDGHRSDDDDDHGDDD